MALSAVSRWIDADIFEKIYKISGRLNSLSRLPKKITWWILQITKKEVATTGCKERYQISVRDNHIGRLLFINGEFDLQKLKKVSTLIDISQKTLIDVGANYGSISIPAIKRNLVGRAIAIEPDPRTFEFLKTNVALNSIKKLTLLNVAMGPSEGSIQFGQKYSNPGDSKVVVGDNRSEFSQIIYVKMSTLDKVIAENKILNALLWIDVQGFESSVLQGAKVMLAAKTPVVIEIFPLGIAEYGRERELLDQLEHYSYFADLRFNIRKPKFESTDEFFKVYESLKSTNSFSDFLFI